MDAVGTLKPLTLEERRLEVNQTNIDASSEKICETFKAFQDLSSLEKTKKGFLETRPLNRFSLSLKLTTQLQEYDALCTKTREKILEVAKTNFEFSQIYKGHYDHSVLDTHNLLSKIANDKIKTWVDYLAQQYSINTREDQDWVQGICIEIKECAEKVTSVAHKQIIDWTKACPTEIKITVKKNTRVRKIVPII